MLLIHFNQELIANFGMVPFTLRNQLLLERDGIERIFTK